MQALACRAAAGRLERGEATGDYPMISFNATELVNELPSTEGGSPLRAA